MARVRNVYEFQSTVSSSTASACSLKVGPVHEPTRSLYLVKRLLVLSSRILLLKPALNPNSHQTQVSVSVRQPAHSDVLCRGEKTRASVLASGLLVSRQSDFGPYSCQVIGSSTHRAPTGRRSILAILFSIWSLQSSSRFVFRRPSTATNLSPSLE